MGGYKPTAFRPVVKHYSIDHLQMESELIQEKKIFPPPRRENGTFNTPDELVRDLITRASLAFSRRCIGPTGCRCKNFLSRTKKKKKVTFPANQIFFFFPKNKLKSQLEMIVERRIATFIPYLWPPALLLSSTPRWNFNPLKKKNFPPSREGKWNI